MPRPTLQDQLLQLTRADTRETLLETVFRATRGLESATLWWQDDELAIPLAVVGRGEEGPRIPLPVAPGYLLSVTPQIDVLPGLLAVLGLRLAYLDLQQQLSDLKPEHRVLATAAYTDALTGLLNRRALDRDLDALEAAGNSFGVVFIDLDGFKTFNDRYGHALGDSLLRGYGVWLSRQLGTLGTVYRLGGDEYVGVMTSQVLSAQEFHDWAHERFQNAFVDGIGASIGIAWRHEHPHLSEILRLADVRMYQSKTARKAPRRAAPWSSLDMMPEHRPDAHTAPVPGIGLPARVRRRTRAT